MIQRLNKKIYAGAMFYALLVVLVVTSILTAMMSISYLSHRHLHTLMNQTKLNYNIEAGFKIALEDRSIMNGESVYIDLFDDKNDSISIRNELWGTYDLISVRASLGGAVKDISYFVGGETFDEDKLALYICDKYKPVVLCGTTLIEGNCKLPISGLKRGYVNGNHYLRKELVYGVVNQSGRELNFIRTDIIRRNLDYFKGFTNENDSLVEFKGLEQDSLRINFKNRALTLYDPENTQLSKIHLTGKVKIICGQSIFIDSTANLEDVIVYANNIIIGPGFEGSGQFISNNTIRIDSSVYLKYPSSLLVFNENYEEGDLIQIGPNSKVEGSVLLLDLNPSKKNKAKVFFDEKSTITGVVYVQGIVELRNTIIGSLYCEGVFHTTNRTRYDNHIFNGTISRTQLPSYFVFPELFQSSRKRKPIKRL